LVGDVTAFLKNVKVRVPVDAVVGEFHFKEAATAGGPISPELCSAELPKVGD